MLGPSKPLLVGATILGFFIALVLWLREPRLDSATPIGRTSHTDVHTDPVIWPKKRPETTEASNADGGRQGLRTRATGIGLGKQSIGVNCSEVNTGDLQAVSIHEDLAGARPSQAPWGKPRTLVEESNTDVFVDLPQAEIGLLFGPHVKPLVLRTTPAPESPPKLQPGSPTTVRLQGLDEQASHPIVVTITGLFYAPDHPGVCIPWRWTIDATSSEIPIPTVPGESMLTIAQGTKKAVWIGELPVPAGSLTLDLRPTYSAGGRVANYPSSTDEPVSVTARLIEADVDRVVGRASVGPDGAWKMEGIPWISEQPYWFRLDCQTAVPSESRVVPGPPSTNAVVSLRWDPGQLQRLKVLDVSGTPVVGVGVKMQWQDGEDWISAYARSGPEGSVRIHHVPEASAYFRILSDDYASDAQGPWQVPTHESRTLQLVAVRTTTLAGRLVPKSLTTEGFSVSYWSPHGAPITKSFGPDAQGFFEITKVRRGAISLVARCPNGSTSAEIKEIDPGMLDGDLVEIGLIPPISASGRVVDHVSGEGIVGAAVEVLWITNNGYSLGSLGQPLLTGSGGYFHDLRVPTGEASVLVKAAGMANGIQPHVFPRLAPGPLPEIRLQPLQALTLRLIGAVDYLDRYQFIQESIAGTTTSHFSENGTLHFPACAPTPYNYVTIETPFGSIFNVVVRLASGKEWDISIPVKAEQSYRVDYASVVAAGHMGPYYIRTTYTDAKGVEINHTRPATADNHEYLLNDIPTGIVTIALHSSGNWVASRSVDLRKETSDRITLEPSKPRGRIRVIGTESVPLTYAATQIASHRSNGHGISVFRKTNGDLELFAIDLGPAVLSVRSDFHPMMLFTTECVVVDDPESSVEVSAVHDGVLRFETWLPSGAPATARLVVHPKIAPDSKLELISSGSGSQADVLVTAGFYGWTLDSPQYWPSSGTVEVQSGTEKVSVTVRRPGLVELTGPASTDLVVWSEDDEQAVTTWQDLVPELAVTRTSSNGKLSLKLPEGPFRVWPASVGPSAAVPFVVVASGTVAVQVQP